MPPDQVRLGRKRPVPSCPNPLFLQWLTELRDHAKENDSKTQHVYQKAIISLKKYPLPLKNGKEAKILQNFGDGICKILDERLQKHCRENKSDAPVHKVTLYHSGDMAEPHKDTEKNDDHMKRPQNDLIKKKATKRKKQYVPQKRSGGYAVLLALYRHAQMPGSKDFMFKNELQSKAQALCDKSFTVPGLGSKYTAWSSVNMLIYKNLLVKTHNNPARYSLTEQGLAVAEKLNSEEGGIDEDPMEDKSDEESFVDGPDVLDMTLEKEEEGERESCPRKSSKRLVTALSVNNAKITISNSDAPGRSQSLELGKTLLSWNLLPDSYEIILCVDFMETTGGSSARKQELVKELQRNGVTFDIRKLNVGDFLWVAREKVMPVAEQLCRPVGKELVLDYIIERKRMDDLCGSIIDGRFREQKFRLKRCGLRRPIYLVEECGSAAAHLSLPESTLQQAVVNTQVVDGFFVKHVQDVKESAAFLTIMTRYLQKLYQNCTLFCYSKELEGDVECKKAQTEILSCSLMSFTEFNYRAIKNKCQTVREVFARQLMQISGVSGDKATAILELYGTVSSLLGAYDQCSSETEKEKLLSSVKYGKLKRNLGPALSRTIYQLFCTRGPLL